MNTVSPNSEIALYKQLALIIESNIKSNELKQGDKLPSELEFMKQYQVSRVTVRAALKSLEEEGLLTRSHGRGTFVAAPKSYYCANDIVGFTKTYSLIGKKVETILLKQRMVEPSKNIQKILGTAQDEQVLMTERLRSVDGSPMCIETNYYGSRLNCLLYENLEGSLFELLNQKYNIAVKHKVRTVSVCRADSYESKILNINHNVPLLLFKDQLVDAEDQLLYFSKQVYYTDNVEFYIY